MRTNPQQIVLVDFYWTRNKDPRVPLGHASLLASLKTLPNIDVHSLVYTVNKRVSKDDVVQDILRLAKGCPHSSTSVAFGAYVWGEALLQSVLPELRRQGFRGRIILGGPQISYSGLGLESIYPDADVFVRGYGEDALCLVAQSEPGAVIPGVVWSNQRDQVQQANVDLEALPSPFLTGLIPLRRQAFVRWETQRGCQFRCAFCQHREAGSRLTRRNLGLPRVEAEIELFCGSSVREIAVLDPIFNMSPHAIGILDRFGDLGFSGRLALQCRAEMITDEFLDSAQSLDVKLELGLQTIHQNEGKAIKRQNHIGKVDIALRGIRERSLSHEVSLIFGLPNQTLQSFEESVQWCLSRGVPTIKAFPLMLLRGTELDLNRAQWSLKDSGGTMPMVTSSNSFNEESWNAMASLSEALIATEGSHPKTISELYEVADALAPVQERWSAA